MSPAKAKASPPVLDGRQRRHLRALGHHQKPVVQIGTQGLTPGVLQAVDDALDRHELVKVRVASEAAKTVDELSSEIAGGTRSALAQTIGRTLLLYRPHPKKPRIVLPRGGAGEGAGKSGASGKGGASGKSKSGASGKSAAAGKSEAEEDE